MYHIVLCISGIGPSPVILGQPKNGKMENVIPK